MRFKLRKNLVIDLYHVLVLRPLRYKIQINNNH
jgi:hypothetical protein